MDDEANLGLATTRELLDELQARGQVSVETGLHVDDAMLIVGTAAFLLTELPAQLLDYSTVGSWA